MRSMQHELQDLPLFADTGRAEMALIARQLTRVTLASGTVFVHEGAVGNEFVIIFEGQAQVTQGDRVVATLGRGDLVGEMALMHERGLGRRNATVTATTELVVYVGTTLEFRRMIGAAPSVEAKVRRTVAQRSQAAA